LHTFYRLPTKLFVLAFILSTIGVALGNNIVLAEDRDMLMDLSRGGTEMFNEVVPSIVQVFNGESSGSGYMIDREGHFITNAHVTGGYPTVEVAFYGDHENVRGNPNSRWMGTVISEDHALDLAVVRVEAPAEKFSPVRLGDSSVVLPGDQCATFGSPGGDPGWVDRSFENFEDSWLEFYNLNLGIVSEVNSFEEAFWTYRSNFFQDYTQRVGVRDYGSAVEYLLHVDAAINHGNSGGPCLNAYGEVIGTNTWGMGGENLGMSVPVNLIKDAATDIIQYGRVLRPWCGFSLHPSRMPQQELMRSWQNETYPGPIGTPFDTTPDELKVYHVNPYSPAYEAGLRDGDVILRIDGEQYENIFDIYSKVLHGEIGDTMIIEYERDSTVMPWLSVELDEKKTRFSGTDVFVGGAGSYVGDYTSYTSDLTY